MPYTIRVDAPGGPKPEENWLKWTMWAQNNAPFTDVTTPDMAAYVEALTNTDAAGLGTILRFGGTLLPGQVKCLPTHDHPDIAKVVEFARSKGYGLIVEVSGQTINQYLAKAGSD